VDERSHRLERAFSTPVIIASLLTIPVIVIEASDLGEPWLAIGSILNWGTWLVFLAEVVVMLAVVPDRKLWLRENYLAVALVILTPPVLPPGLQSLRLLRLLRILRLLRLAPIARRLFSTGGLRFSAFMALVAVPATAGRGDRGNGGRGRGDRGSDRASASGGQPAPRPA
jgi:voltage-gated potassium channel